MTNITHFSFDGAAVRVQIDASGQPWFNATDVCEALELGNPSQALKSHVDGDDLQKMEVIDALGRTQRANHVNESGLYALILGSAKPEAKRFKRWVTSEVLPAIRKTGSYSIAPQQPVLPAEHADHLAAIEIMARMLNASESGKLTMMRAYATHSAPALLPAIPAYAIDAPVIAGQTATSSEVTKSATALLKEAGSALSARAFNALALERGFLAKVTRAGSKGIKEFLVVTDAGLRWGKNVISPQNPRESQPHWYSRSFPALLTELN